MDEFLYWFRDNPKRELKTDIEWATFKFQRRFDGKQPSILFVNPTEEKEFEGLGFDIKTDNRIGTGFFGIG